VRLDSGDLASLAREVRKILDAGGLSHTRILASGDLDEHRIAAIVQSDAPIDGFGVGAAISTSSDVPALGGVYKLVELERNGVRVGVAKLSPGKQTWPGRKQVWRTFRGAEAAGDLIALEEEQPIVGATPLLVQAMRQGVRTLPRRSVIELQQRCRSQVAQLPAGLRRIDSTEAYPVKLSERLQAAGSELAARAAQGSFGGTS
jgi:nicotinate phosphoribosyltransferase